MVGVLFIVATVAPILTVVFLGPLGGPIVGSSLSPDFLVGVSARENQVMIGMLIELVWALSVVGIPVMLFPILKKHNEALALGFFSLRSIEAISTVVRSIFLLSLLTLSREFAGAVAPDASHYQTLGTLLLEARDWAFALGSGLVFTLSALVLNYVLYRSKLVPRWLSGWGFIAAAMFLADCLLRLFGINLPEILFVPIAVQEMVFAGWLILRGFNPPAIASESAGMEPT